MDGGDASDVASDLGIDAVPDVMGFDEGPPEDVRSVPPGLGVVLRPDGRIDIGIDGVPFDASEFIVRFADGTERALSSLTIEPVTDASMALEGTDGSALRVRLSLAISGTDAVTVDWSVQSTRSVQGIELRTMRTALPDEAHVVMEGSQSWSFAGPLAIAAGAMLPHDATGVITYPSAIGNVLDDVAGRGWFRGDVVWRAGGLSVCATSPYDRALVVSLERPTTRYVLRVTDGVFVDERVTPDPVPLHGAFVLAHADPANPFACHVVAPPPARTRGDRPMPRGWWSWNTLFQNVTTASVNAQLDPLGAMDPGAHHVTVDDGWEPSWGDWTERPGFGGTLADLATQLSSRGTTLGLWLAPFLVSTSSPLLASHPDWFIHDPSGAAVNVAVGLGTNYAVLDATHPDVLAYLTGVFQRLRTAGIRLFKIDFLYAAAQPGVRHDALASGLVAYRRGLEAIAAGAGDAHINGCGALLLPSLAYVDSIRIASDNTFSGVAPFWGSVAGTARNLATRLGLATYGVLADPDQPVVRGFTDDEARVFLAVGLVSGGAFGYGDDLSALTDSQRALFHEPWFLALRDGHHPAPAHPVDLFESVGTAFVDSPILDAIGSRRGTTQSRPPSVWLYDGTGTEREVVLFNWTTAPTDESVTSAAFLAGVAPVELVANDTVRISAGTYTVTVPPHAVRVLSGVRP